MALKDELPRLVGAQHATGEDWRSNSRKNEETETKLESRLVGEISITSDMQMTPPYDRKWRGAEEPLDESKREQRKSWFKTQHSEN